MYKSLFPNVSCYPGGIPTSFTPSSTIITAFGGHAVGLHGTCVLNLDYGGSCKSCPFHVVDADGPTLLGLPTSTDLNLVTMNFSITNHKGVSNPSTPPRPICDPDPVAEEQVLKLFKDCFEGVGCFQGEYHITADPAIPPVVNPPRRVPEALREPLKKELDLLVEQGILANLLSQLTGSAPLFTSLRALVRCGFAWILKIFFFKECNFIYRPKHLHYLQCK